MRDHSVEGALVKFRVKSESNKKMGVPSLNVKIKSAMDAWRVPQYVGDGLDHRKLKVEGFLFYSERNKPGKKGVNFPLGMGYYGIITMVC